MLSMGLQGDGRQGLSSDVCAPASLKRDRITSPHSLSLSRQLS